MKKFSLMLLMVTVFTLFATSSAFATVEEQPIQLEEVQLEETTVSAEATAVEATQTSTDQPVATPYSEEGTEAVDQPVPIATQTSDSPEIAKALAIENSSTSNQKWIYLAGAVMVIGLASVMFIKRRSKII